MNDLSLHVEAFLENHEPKLQPEVVALLRPLIEARHYPKKHLLVRENEVHGKVYLVLKGASRSFYLQNGREVHTWFAFEDDVIGSLRNFKDLPSRESIELLEDSLLLAFDIPGMRRLMASHGELALFVNQALLDYALFMEERFFDFNLRSAHEKFTTLMRKEPELFQRVPLTYIASYLGISRETLSRMRAV